MSPSQIIWEYFAEERTKQADRKGSALTRVTFYLKGEVVDHVRAVDANAWLKIAPFAGKLLAVSEDRLGRFVLELAHGERM